jgi:integrase/recombinase XerD
MKINQDSFQSSLAKEIMRYISLKQALGRRFEGASMVLLGLDRFLCMLEKPSPDLTAETFQQWCQTLESVSSNTRLARMRVVRNFCLYRRRTASACFVPDPTQFPPARPTVQPYVFSESEMARLLSYSACISGSNRSPLRGAATRLAIILLYTAGLRRGELLRLTVEDYDPSAQTLLIRASKFHKSRLLPLSGDVAAEIEQFLKMHKAIRPPLPPQAPLLWNPYCGGRVYTSTQLRKNLHILLRRAGIKKPDGRRPRIHDFRFSFAVNVLLRWYRNRVDVQAKLPFLAAYMGHISILSTYYYLRFIEPLAKLASDSFAAHYGALIQVMERRRYGES